MRRRIAVSKTSTRAPARTKPAVSERPNAARRTAIVSRKTSAGGADLPTATDANARTAEISRATVAGELRQRKALIRSDINTTFEEHQTVSEALADNLKKRTLASGALTARARKAFSSFTPREQAAARTRKGYVMEGVDLAGAQTAAITTGIDSIRRSGTAHGLRLRASDALKALIENGPRTADIAAGRLGLGPLLNYIALRADGFHYVAEDSLVTSCKAEIEVERRLRAILGTSQVASEALTIDTVDSSAPSNSTSSHLTAATVVKHNVSLQMDTATSPESPLRYSASTRGDQMDIQNNIQTFELRSGPSDVTSFHDFHNLQIAFENVWTEIFDDRLGLLGRQLYEDYVKMKVFSGGDDGTDPTISTLDDLRELMAEVKTFTQQTLQNVAPAVAPGKSGTADGAPIVTTYGSVTNAAVRVGAAAILPLLGLDPVTSIVVGEILGWL